MFRLILSILFLASLCFAQSLDAWVADTSDANFFFLYDAQGYLDWRRGR